MKAGARLGGVAEEQGGDDEFPVHRAGGGLAHGRAARRLTLMVERESDEGSDGRVALVGHHQVVLPLHAVALAEFASKVASSVSLFPIAMVGEDGSLMIRMMIRST